jgi:hypothetical protein
MGDASDARRSRGETAAGSGFGAAQDSKSGAHSELAYADGREATTKNAGGRVRTVAESALAATFEPSLTKNSD